MTHHIGRHVTFWFLLLGVFWLPLPSLTADLNTTCETHAEGKFKIRAMIYTTNFAYLVDSDGQLCVEDAATFLRGIEHYRPTIKLNKPVSSLSTNWYGLKGQVDYADPGIQFGFTNDDPDDSSQDTVTLRMITYKPADRFGYSLALCVYSGIQMNGKEAPSEEETPLCKKIDSDDKSWLNDKWTMYSINLQDDGMTMEIVPFKLRVQEELLKVSKFDDIFPRIDTFEESNVKPQSGLLTEKVIFIASEDSTGHFLSQISNCSLDLIYHFIDCHFK